MKKKKAIIATVTSVTAAIVLSGVTVTAKPENKVPESGVVAKVGKIVPVNLLLGAVKFSDSKAFADECCGPYAQKCSGFRGT